MHSLFRGVPSITQENGTWDICEIARSTINHKLKSNQICLKVKYTKNNCALLNGWEKKKLN